MSSSQFKPSYLNTATTDNRYTSLLGVKNKKDTKKRNAGARPDNNGPAKQRAKNRAAAISHAVAVKAEEVEKGIDAAATKSGHRSSSISSKVGSVISYQSSGNDSGGCCCGGDGGRGIPRLVTRIERLDKILTVSKALRRNSGRVNVEGTVVSVSPPYKLVVKAAWRCNECCFEECRHVFDLLQAPKKPKRCSACGSEELTGQHRYVNATSLLLQDDGISSSSNSSCDVRNARDQSPDPTEAGSSSPSPATLDVLDVIVSFEKEEEENKKKETSSWLKEGQRIKVIGHIHAIKLGGGSSGRFYPVVLARSVEHFQSDLIQITGADVSAFERFAGRAPLWGTEKSMLPSSVQEVTNRLARLFAPNIVGHDDKKLALLIAMVGAEAQPSNIGNGHDSNGSHCGSYQDGGGKDASATATTAAATTTATARRTWKIKKQGIKGRINVVMVGPPGTGKTRLAREAVKVIPNSMFVSRNTTTGRALAGIIERRRGDAQGYHHYYYSQYAAQYNHNHHHHQHTLKPGPVLLAQNAICAVNEFDKLSVSDQDYLLDAMDEDDNVTTINKYARLATVSSPATLIATANPRGRGSRSGSIHWIDRAVEGGVEGDEKRKVSLDAMPFEHRMLDRFDIWLVFKNQSEAEQLREFAYAKVAYDERHSSCPSGYYYSNDYTFLRKYLMFAKTIVPRVTDEAKSILVETFVRLKGAAPTVITTRTLETLFRVAKAFARLCLRDAAAAEIARHAANFITEMYDNFDLAAGRGGGQAGASIAEAVAENPQDVAHYETIAVIKEATSNNHYSDAGGNGGGGNHVGDAISNNGSGAGGCGDSAKENCSISIIEAVKIACTRNGQVRAYIGQDLNQNTNRKLRRLVERIREWDGDRIEVVQSKPMRVRWKGDKNVKGERCGDDDEKCGAREEEGEGEGGGVATGRGTTADAAA